MVRAAARAPTAFAIAYSAVYRHRASQKVVELTELLRLLRLHPPSVVVEIGSRRGGTLYAWCRIATTRASVVSVDLHPRDDDAERVATYRRHALPEQTLTAIRSNSQDPVTVERVRDAIGRQPVDLLFLDGDHSYEGVRRDFELYSPMVGTGGWVVLHDIVESDKHPEYGVHRLWRELRARGDIHEFVDSSDPRAGMGLGVLRLP